MLARAVALAQAGRGAGRRFATAVARSATAAPKRVAARVSIFGGAQPTPGQLMATARGFGTTSRAAEDSPPEQRTAQPLKAADITLAQYHKLADLQIEHLLAKCEEISDTSDVLDVEYSSGVMTITYQDGLTYVLNKQPPNKQIWLASPKSGPKRYDFVLTKEGTENDETPVGDWVYLRDGSTLAELFENELQVPAEPRPKYQ
ncbi:hypothetical protein GGS23DRAFT_496867 [Durotheca rogersii]|uniref:uncharacterized protein n=1 Tax=Durotheca rogersii TaxID=419775 RepID=UPI00221F2137|nr:uncharacterized protein GGS23DRAFT_496867 [Durotheca rogersii]KAI5864376.1 hypothetical protein GGS23DRAFT_496867 [Durotheca rogersii]